MLLRACWWYGQRKRLVQVQAKVVAGPGGGGVTCYYIRTFLHTTTFSPSALSLPFPALEGGCLSRAYAEQQESCCCWRELHWLTRRAKANTLPTSRLLPARERRERVSSYPCPPFGSPIAPPSRTSSSRSSSRTRSTRSSTRVSSVFRGVSCAIRPIRSTRSILCRRPSREIAPQSLFECVWRSTQEIGIDYQGTNYYSCCYQTCLYHAHIVVRLLSSVLLLSPTAPATSPVCSHCAVVSTYPSTPAEHPTQTDARLRSCLPPPTTTSPTTSPTIPSSRTPAPNPLPVLQALAALQR